MVTSSVRIAGVLLVFAYLVVPGIAGIAWGRRWGTRLLLGWSLSASVSLIGIIASAYFDIPTGATIVCVFGLALVVVWSVMVLARVMAAQESSGEATRPVPHETR